MYRHKVSNSIFDLLWLHTIFYGYGWEKFQTCAVIALIILFCSVHVTCTTSKSLFCLPKFCYPSILCCPKNIVQRGHNDLELPCLVMLVYQFDSASMYPFNTPTTPIATLTETSFNSLRPRQNGRHFPDDIFKCIFFNENVWNSLKISWKFVPNNWINYIPALVQIMAWRRSGDKPLSGPMMVILPRHICVTRPQWVNTSCK